MLPVAAAALATIRRPVWRAVLILAVLAGCGRNAPREVPRGESLAVAPTPAESVRSASAESLATRETPASAASASAFTRVALRRSRALEAFRDSLGPAGWRQVLAINRVDSAHVHVGDTLTVPRRFGDSLAFSPFPRVIAALRDTSKALLVSLRVQAFAAYDSGRLVRWGAVSTGRRTKPTPVALFHINWKDRRRTSTFDEEWLLLWYLNLDNFEGVSIHQYDLPGRPASHSCIRLAADDAPWLYAWSESWRLADDQRTVLTPGTPVVVFGEWAWDARAPWKRLAEDASAATLVPEEIADALRVMTTGVKPVFISLPEPGEVRPAPPDSARRASPDSARRAPPDSARR